MSNSLHSCLIHSPSNTISRKRKRTEKTVRFDVERTVIIDTYSPFDYDRGSTFSFPVQYKLNPKLISNIPNGPLLSLNIPSSPCDSEASSPDLEGPSTILSTPASKKIKRPKLTVNTDLCSGDGPLFFTKLSTNHAKHNADDLDCILNDFLIPITTSSAL